MTFAWYAHLRDIKAKSWWIAAILSWGIALFEYLLQVPTNRIGSTALTLPQLKIMQEVITLTVFVPFLLVCMKQPFKWDILWVEYCLCGAFLSSESKVSPNVLTGMKNRAVSLSTMALFHLR